MSFWEGFLIAFDWFEAHITRILAFVLGTITTLVGTGVIPESQLKYWAAAISILNYWRGQAVANTVATAKAIVSSQPEALKS